MGSREGSMASLSEIGTKAAETGGEARPVLRGSASMSNFNSGMASSNGMPSALAGGSSGIAAITTRSGLTIRLDPSVTKQNGYSAPISIGTPPLHGQQGLPHLLGGSSTPRQGAGAAGGSRNAPGVGLPHVHSSPVFRLLQEDSNRRNDSSPSLPPIGLPPARNDTDEDLMHKAVVWEIERDELEWEGSVKLGAGAYGEVVRAKWRGTPVAVKKVTSLTGATATATRELRHEIAVMSHMHHPRVVQFLGACTRQHPWLIIFEYLPGGALSTVLEKRQGRPLPHALAGRWALDTAQGLRYLHEHKPTEVVHRDLKPSNIVVDASGHLKITDFGLAKVVDMLKAAADDSYVMTGETGSYRYMSPEVFRHEKYTEKVDIYALGMLMYYMWHGEPPFAWMPPLEAVRSAAMEHLRPELRPNLNPEIGKLIQTCWHPDPASRPSARDVCRRLEALFPQDNLGHDPIAVAEGCRCSVM